jgi:regulator of protease activity HflC (stomatin/prohibitin superfamily)
MSSWERRLISVGVVAAICIALAVVLGGNLFETVGKGTYQVKQAAISGTMSAKMTPGFWMQMFGDIQTWPKADTFFFTHDKTEGQGMDQSIEVRFNDGSICNISGTMRIQMPTTEDQAIALVTGEGYTSFSDMEAKLMLPVVRNALRLTANLMSARESYQERRADFTFWAWDQIQNGMYETEEYVKEVTDPITKEVAYKTLKRIKKDKDGNVLRQNNPIEGLGLQLANFEIKSFEYHEKVKAQIAAQQDALMAVATAAANAKKAEQEEITAEAEGRRLVTTAQYEKEQEKVKVVLDAQQRKEVAILAAEATKATAELDRDAARFFKEEQILRGEGEAERRKLVMEADGALELKLKTHQAVMFKFAEEFGKQKWVPQVSFGSSGNTGGNEATNLINLLTMQSLNSLGLDVGVKKE